MTSTTSSASQGEFDRLLHATSRTVTPSGESATLSAWWELVAGEVETLAVSGMRAALCGAMADSLDRSFLAGYRVALEALVPGRFPFAELLSFAVSEAGGAHPRAIESSLTERGQTFVLNGEKAWSTLAPLARHLLVAAVHGPVTDGRKPLKMLVVDTDAAGVTIVPRPPTPFLSTIPHGVVTFADAPVQPEQILPGDGYRDYIKAFRTLEDLHVTAAGVGHLLRIARRHDLPSPLSEALLFAAAAAAHLSTQPAAAAGTHLALAGLLNRFHALAAEVSTALQELDPNAASHWQRDAAVFAVADNARRRRRDKAWKIIKAPAA